MKKIITILVCVFFLITLVSADYSYVFEKDTDIDLHVSCFDVNNSFCDATTNCQISIYYPNQSAVILNESMDYNETFFNYSLSEDQTSIVGEYSSIVNCQGANNGFSEFNFLITPSGTEISGEQVTIYIIFLVIAFVIFGLLVYGSFKLKWDNNRDETGQVVSVNDLKWLKLFCMVFSYLTFTFIIAMCYRITDEFLYVGTANSFFEITYNILIAVGSPMLIIFPFVVTYIIFQDVKVKKLLQRGLQPR